MLIMRYQTRSCAQGVHGLKNRGHHGACRRAAALTTTASVCVSSRSSTFSHSSFSRYRYRCLFNFYFVFSIGSAIKLHCESCLAYCLGKRSNAASIAETAAIEHYRLDPCCLRILCQLLPSSRAASIFFAFMPFVVAGNEASSGRIINNLRMQIAV
jgi:hypothetical protein